MESSWWSECGLPFNRQLDDQVRVGIGRSLHCVVLKFVPRVHVLFGIMRMRRKRLLEEDPVAFRATALARPAPNPIRPSLARSQRLVFGCCVGLREVIDSVTLGIFWTGQGRAGKQKPVTRLHVGSDLQKWGRG